MSDDSGTYLPDTATGLARAMDLLERRLLQLPVQMIAKDPFVVDVKLLDHLAWELSVDVWDFDWPEDIKRNMIAASVELHRFKGTPHAIKRALAIFDVDTEFLEWFEPEGVSEGLERGSFRVTAYASRSLYGENESSIDNRMVHAMNAVVQRIAPVSRRIVFRLGESFQTDGFTRVGTHVSRVHQVEVNPDPRPNVAEGGPFVRAGVGTFYVSSGALAVRPRLARATTITFARLATDVRVVSHEYHDVQRRQVG